MVVPLDGPCLGRNLELDSLSERHYGITAEIGGSYAQAAAVCLTRHHTSPAVARISTDAGRSDVHRTLWLTPTVRIRAGWANADDTTRDGAYGIVLAAAEAHLGLVGVRRSAV